MGRFLCICLSLLMLSGILTECGRQETNSLESQKSIQKDEASEAQDEPVGLIKPSKPDSMRLTIYTSNPSDMINPIVKEFQNRTGVTVDFVLGGTGVLMKRVQAETGNPQGDIIWGGGTDTYAANLNLFEPYKTAEDDMIDPKYKDKDNLWTGFTVIPTVIIYNTKLVKPDAAPKAWADLLNPRFKGKIAMGDPAKLGSTYTNIVTAIIAMGRDNGKGWQYIKRLVKNLDGKIISSAAQAPVLVADGEYSVCIAIEDWGLKSKAAGKPVEFIYPSEGTSVVADGAAIIKGAENMENAKKFIDFIAGKDAQRIVVNEFKRRSVRTDISAEGLIPLDRIKLINYDIKWASEKKNDILKDWKALVEGK